MSSRSSDSPVSIDGDIFEPPFSRYTFSHVSYHGKSREEHQETMSGSDFPINAQQIPTIEDRNPNTTFFPSDDVCQCSSTSSLPFTPCKRLDIRGNDGFLDLHKLLQSGVRIPLHLPPVLVLPLLIRANIGHARMILLERRINRLQDRKDNSSSTAPAHEKGTAEEREALQNRKEAFMYQMLTNAREAIDTASLLRRPDLQARGFWYLAVAAREEGNELLWESYLEECLEARDSLEGRVAAEELGIHENEDVYESGNETRSSTLCEEFQREADKERMRVVSNETLGVGKAWR
jgi:hypothetical protein